MVNEEMDKLISSTPTILHVGPKDFLLFTYPGKLSFDTYKLLSSTLQTEFGNVIVLEDGLRLTSCIKFDMSDNSEEHY